MRLIDILPPYEIRIFDNPPILSSDDQKYYFKIDDTLRRLLKGIKEEHNKVGLLLQYGYFKASRVQWKNTQNCRFTFKNLL